MVKFEYSGDELDTFALAENWKEYWSSFVRRYMGKFVLEVGAGIGANTQILQVEEIERWVCIEPDLNLYERIKEMKHVNRSLGAIEVIACVTSQLPKEEFFDTIIYIDVLEHIDQDKNELKEAASRLKCGGRIIIVSPAHNYLFSSFDLKIGHFRRYNKRMLKDLVPSGFVIVDLRYLDSIGLFASLANRIILKESDPSPAQIKFWDKYMITMSRKIDPLIGFRAGKSIFAAIQKESL